MYRAVHVPYDCTIIDSTKMVMITNGPSVENVNLISLWERGLTMPVLLRIAINCVP